MGDIYVALAIAEHRHGLDSEMGDLNRCSPNIQRVFFALLLFLAAQRIEDLNIKIKALSAFSAYRHVV